MLSVVVWVVALASARLAGSAARAAESGSSFKMLIRYPRENFTLLRAFSALIRGGGIRFRLQILVEDNQDKETEQH